MSPAGSGNTRQSLCQNRELMWRVRVHCGADRRPLSALWSTLILSVVAYHLQLWFILVILAADKNSGCNCVISVQCHDRGHYYPYYVMSHGRQMKYVYAWVSSILTLHRNAQYIIVYSQQLLLGLQIYLLLCNWAVVSAISPTKLILFRNQYFGYLYHWTKSIINQLHSLNSTAGLAPVQTYLFCIEDNIHITAAVSKTKLECNTNKARILKNLSLLIIILISTNEFPIPQFILS